MLLNLPEDAWRSIAIHLPPQDILSFLSVHKNINNHLAKSSPSFWKQLLAIHRDEDIDTNNTSTTTTTDIQDARNEFMLQSYKSALPKVKWIPLDINNTFPVSAREGHISCVLNGPDNYKSLVITGGFTDDEGITVLSLPSGYKSHTKTWGWTRLLPERGCGTSFVYGASLTALPPIDNTANPNVHIAKAVRFGGFAGGGYSQEVNEVWVLTIRDEEHSNGTLSQTASWERIRTSGAIVRSRAYHTATLLHNRYLVVIGGMTEQGSILEESILDTHTWTWIDLILVCQGAPSGRHGHSVVHDKRRDRLVLFGGGNGTDLLRSGYDNNEIWELKMNRIEIPSPLVKDEMWQWNKLHGDEISDDSSNDDDDDEEYRGDDSNDEEEDNEEEEGGGGDDEEEEENSTSSSSNNTSTTNRLSPTESLCLGRCHNGMKIAPDTVLFMFGSGHPNTNGILGYNLSTDSFIRPTVSGPLPMPRFTGVASFLDTEGYVFVHGGYSTGAGAIKDLYLLDLAPHLNRNFTSLDVDANRRSNRAVESSDMDEIADRIEGGGNAMSRLLMQNLLGMIDANELQEMIARGGV